LGVIAWRGGSVASSVESGQDNLMMHCSIERLYVRQR
jgi:hypothetical protein